MFKRLEVKVIEGFVFLSGRLDTLFDKKRIQKVCADIPDVKKVILKDIILMPDKELTDQELERKISLFIGTILKKEKRAISVKAKQPIVRLVGAIKEQEDLDQVIEFVSKQPGISKIINDISVATAVVKKNMKLARKVEEKMKRLFDGVKHVTVKLYGDFVEVSGVVKLKEDRKNY